MTKWELRKERREKVYHLIVDLYRKMKMAELETNIEYFTLSLEERRNFLIENIKAAFPNDELDNLSLLDNLYLIYGSFMDMGKYLESMKAIYKDLCVVHN